MQQRCAVVWCIVSRNDASAAPQDITRIALAVLFSGLIIFASLWVLWPLVAATVWATMIVVATWPMMRGQIETAVRRLGEDLGIDRVVDAR